MEQQEYFLRINELGQEAEKLEQQIQLMEQQMQELLAVRSSLENIKDKGKLEILSHLGKGIFIKTEIKDEELFVNIGREVIVKKKPAEAIKIINLELNKLSLGKENFILKIQELQEEMQKIIDHKKI